MSEKLEEINYGEYRRLNDFPFNVAGQLSQQTKWRAKETWSQTQMEFIFKKSIFLWQSLLFFRLLFFPILGLASRSKPPSRHTHTKDAGIYCFSEPSSSTHQFSPPSFFVVFKPKQSLPQNLWPTNGKWCDFRFLIFNQNVRRVHRKKKKRPLRKLRGIFAKKKKKIH